MIKYARFMAVYLFSLATLTGILLGGAWMWLGFVVIYGVMILGDESLGDYYEEPAYRHPRLLNSLLYFALPALFVLGVAMDSRLQLHLGLEDPLALLFSLAQMGIGAPYVAARVLGFEAGLVTSPSYEYGNTFTAVAGLLNILVILDALDTARGVRGK